MNHKISSLPPVHEMMTDCGLQPKKQFGQNFLFDLNLTRKIARSIPNIENSIVIEVGPGPGGLTRALLECGAKKVIAIEKDYTTAPILNRVAYAADGRLEIIYGDALKQDFVFETDDSDFAICSNLPYNIGTELLINWLHNLKNIGSLTLMFQREVAMRIVAKTGEPQYGRLSVLTNLVADAKILFNVPNTAFYPAPKVQSSVVQIIPKSEISNIDLKKIGMLTAKLFGQRRKMIRSIMKNIDWQQFGLTGTERAEELSPQKFVQLAQKINV